MKKVKEIVLPIIVFAFAYLALEYLLWYGIAYAFIIWVFRLTESKEPKFFEYLWKCAVAIDQTLNVILLFPLNDLMRKPKGTMYGNPDETISGVTGKNQLSGKLTWFGKGVNWILNKLDKNHSVKAIEHDEE